MRPYVKSSKNDARDAEAICEAVTRPSMRFVTVKSQAQQDMLALHRVRALLIRERTALMNQVRGLLAERGIVVAQGEAQLRRALAELLGDHDEHVGELLREALAEMNERLGLLEERLSVWPADREVRDTNCSRQSPRGRAAVRPEVPSRRGTDLCTRHSAGGHLPVQARSDPGRGLRSVTQAPPQRATSPCCRNHQ